MTNLSASSPHTLGDHLTPLRRNWGWLMGAGIALVILGGLGLAVPFLFTLSSAFMFGVMMLIAGAILLVDAFRREGWKSRALMIVIGVIYVLAGLLTFYNPLATIVALTLLIGAALTATGVLRIVMAFQMRPMSAWVWVLVSGLLSLLLGGLILFSWPASSAWVLGTFLAIELIFQGFSYIMLAQAIRSTFDGVRPRT